MGQEGFLFFLLLMIVFDRKNGHHAFYHILLALIPRVYFLTVMDGVGPPSSLLLQIIANQYALKARHRNNILTRNLFSAMLSSPSFSRESAVTTTLAILAEQLMQ